MTHEDADGAIADAIWWLKGFAAAQPQDERTALNGMVSKLIAARRWMIDLSDGTARLIGVDDNALAFAIREHEFEHAWDALRDPCSDAERKVAADMLSKVYETVKRERANASAAKNRELPF